MCEDGDQKFSQLKQEIEEQLRLANDNLIKSQDQTKEIVEKAEKGNAIKIQEVKDKTEFWIGQQKQELKAID